MRKVTQRVVSAFKYGNTLKVGNTRTDGQALYLHDNKIAEKRNGCLWITDAGWQTNTTKERLNGLWGVEVYQKNWKWYLNNKEWDGNWINVQTNQQDQYNPLSSIAMVAKMGEVLCNTQKEKNDWKVRMLKAGLEGKGLIMPDDWETLSEEGKQKRLDDAIAQIS